MQETTTMSSRNPNTYTQKPDHEHKKTEQSHSKESKIASSSSSSSEITTNHSTSPDSFSTKKGENVSVENGRERLKRHRVEVAGRVWIPDMWGQESLLKDWIDCTAFDATLMNSSIMSARAAMMEEAGRRRTSATTTAVPHVLRLENSC